MYKSSTLRSSRFGFLTLLVIHVSLKEKSSRVGAVVRTLYFIAWYDLCSRAVKLALVDNMVNNHRSALKVYSIFVSLIHRC
jgi:hypothetical protein